MGATFPKAITPNNKDSQCPVMAEAHGKQRAAEEVHLGEAKCFTDTHGIITSTMNEIPGYQVVKVLGAVYGLTVRSRNWGAGLASVLKSVVGGELVYLTNLLYSGRNSAVERMVGECMSRGGNAIIALRFDTAEIMNFAQVCAYGTAVVVEPIQKK
jgi:uncharacterized protein YbjQ (UPF0145 family)